MVTMMTPICIFAVGAENPRNDPAVVNPVNIEKP